MKHTIETKDKTIKELVPAHYVEKTVGQEKTFHLTLNEREMCALASICGLISGSGEIRGLLNDIFFTCANLGELDMLRYEMGQKISVSGSVKP